MKRFDLWGNVYSNVSGRFVMYEDAARLEAEVERLTARVAELEEAVRPLLALHARALRDDLAPLVEWDSAVFRARAALAAEEGETT